VGISSSDEPAAALFAEEKATVKGRADFWNSKPGQEFRASELEAEILAARKCRLF